MPKHHATKVWRHLKLLLYVLKISALDGGSQLDAIVAPVLKKRAPATQLHGTLSASQNRSGGGSEEKNYVTY